MNRDDAALTLGVLGLAGLHAEIEITRSERSDLTVPVVTVVDGHASVGWTELVPLSLGGAA
jgi:hypothetical protein